MKLLKTLYQEFQYFAKTTENNDESNKFSFESPVKQNEGKFIHLFSINQEPNENYSIDKEEEKTPNNIEKTSTQDSQYKLDSIKDENKSFKIESELDKKSAVTNEFERKSLVPNKKKFDEIISSGDEGSKKSDSRKIKPNKNIKTTNEIKKNPKSLKESEELISSQLQNILKHICFKMQINRLPRSKLLITLFGSTDKEKIIAQSDLISFFKKDPFNFSDASDQKALASCFCNSKSTIRSIGEKLLQIIGEWEIFSQEDEEEYDNQLGILISQDKLKLKEKCKDFDVNHKGEISLESFNKILNELNIQVPERIFKYMQLLFYSHESKLDTVPYRYFIKAYGNTPEEEKQEYELDESADSDSESKIISQYIKMIFQVLAQNNLAASDVFEIDDNGLIHPIQFYEGIQSLGLDEINEKYTLAIVEALRYKGSDDLCIHIQELNEILQQNYSPAENSQNLDEGFNNRISLFGSEKENYNHKQIDLENPENSCLSANHDKIKRAESFQSDEYYHYDDSDD